MKDGRTAYFVGGILFSIAAYQLYQWVMPFLSDMCKAGFGECG